MTNEAMLVVIVYDTPDDNRRRRLARLLEDVADRVQWSVFEGWLTTEQIDDCWQRLQRVVIPDKDRLRLYRVCQYCRDASRVLGPQQLEPLAEYWIV
jgi:CRISPR-associated protein Cas2